MCAQFKTSHITIVVYTIQLFIIKYKIAHFIFTLFHIRAVVSGDKNKSPPHIPILKASPTALLTTLVQHSHANVTCTAIIKHQIIHHALHTQQ